MKFRAQLSNINLHYLLDVTSAMEKIANRILLKITPEVFCLIVDSTVAMDGTEGVECFCTLRQAHLFDELIVESKNQNQVMVEMLAGNFTQALKSGQLADSVVLRLTKRNGLACLTLEALLVIQMPDPKSTRQVVDKMKSVSKHLVLHGSSSGRMVFRVSTEMVTIRTFYTGLQVGLVNTARNRDDVPESPDPSHEAGTLSGASSRKRSSGTHPSPHFADIGGDGGEMQVAAMVPIKSFLRVLNCHLAKPALVQCCFLKDRALVVHVRLPNNIGIMVYYTPIVLLDGDSWESELTAPKKRKTENCPQDLSAGLSLPEETMQSGEPYSQ